MIRMSADAIKLLKPKVFDKSKWMQLPRDVIIGHDVLRQIPSVCEDLKLGTSALLISGKSTMTLAGENVRHILGKGYSVKPFIAEEISVPVIRKAQKASVDLPKNPYWSQKQHGVKVTLVPVQINQETAREFRQRLMDWWSKNARALPWRQNPSPYSVLVSEIMLQQTQVNRVIPKYLEFLREFPTMEALAASETKPLLTVWSGLGYNRRALWLREAAREIVARGGFPQEVKDLRELKGIGPYTSRSILIFAFNKDLAAVDTNIRRVLIASGLADESMTHKEVQAVADALLLRGRSSDWHNALMDYGSEVLTASTTGIAPTSRQPKFKRSTRQVRGVIVRVLTQNNSLSLRQLLSQLDFECSEGDIQPILDQMVAERLIEFTGARNYRIVD